MSKRAVRRSHYIRLKRKRLNQLKDSWWYYTHYTEEELNKNAASLVNTPRRCSCQLCCNLRHNKWLPKKEQISIQERKQLINSKEQIHGQN